MVIYLAKKEHVKKSTGQLSPPLKGENEAVGEKTAGVASLMVFGRFVALFFSGIAFIIVARLLGPSVYGIYVLAISFAGFFGSVADLGVSLAVNKYIGQYHPKNKEEVNKVISNGYVSVLITGTIFTIMAILLSHFIAVHVLGNASQTYVLQTVSFAILGAMLFSLSYYAMVGFGKGPYVALVIIMQSVVQSLFSVLFAVMGFGALAPILGMLIGYTSSVITVLIVLISKFKVKFIMPSFNYIKRLLGFSSPISVYNGLRGFINNFSPIILALFATTAIVGNFGVAIKTSSIISNVTDALGLAVLPMFAYTAATKSTSKSVGKYYNYAAYLTYVLITPALLYLAILSKEFSYTIFSAKYLLAPSYISVISVGTLIWIVATYTVMLLVSTSKVREILKYSIAIAIIELALLFTIVPRFGGLGLVIILYIITPSLILLFMSRAAKKLLNIELNLGKLVRVLLAGALSALFILPIMLVFSPNYITILVAAFLEQLVLYPIVLARTGAAGREELKTLWDSTSAIPVMNLIIRKLTGYAEHFVPSESKVLAH